MSVLCSKVNAYPLQRPAAHDRASGMSCSRVAALCFFKRHANDVGNHCVRLALSPGLNARSLAPQGFAVIALTLPGLAGYDCFVTRRTDSQRDAVIREF